MIIQCLIRDRLSENADQLGENVKFLVFRNPETDAFEAESSDIAGVNW